jgi:hypothetical protein
MNPIEKKSKFLYLWRRYGIWIGAAIIVSCL